jgi:alpha-galactosidase
MSQEKSTACSNAEDNVTAPRVAREVPLDARHPAAEWQTATPISFCTDWQGKNADAARQTQVRTLWTPQTLYLRFECRYRELYVFGDSDANGRRDQLWDRDVAEVFLQPDPSRPHYYREVEVSPNGMWVDLDIFPEGRRDLHSGMQRSVWRDREHHTWTAEIAIPIAALTANFDAHKPWKTNFFRIEGSSEPRFYSAWRATNTPVPNFHVPEAFGTLRFKQ